MQQNCECFVNNAKQISIRCVEQMSQNQGCHIVTTFVTMSHIYLDVKVTQNHVKINLGQTPSRITHTKDKGDQYLVALNPTITKTH